jgi:hypothetical protein
LLPHGSGLVTRDQVMPQWKISVVCPPAVLAEQTAQASAAESAVSLVSWPPGGARMTAATAKARGWPLPVACTVLGVAALGAALVIAWRLAL